MDIRLIVVAMFLFATVSGRPIPAGFETDKERLIAMFAEHTIMSSDAIERIVELDAFLIKLLVSLPFRT